MTPVPPFPGAPVLVIGLGNPLAGDDGVGPRIARALQRHPRLPAGVEVVEGGTDLLRLADAMAGRQRVVLVDALLDPERPGRLVRYESAPGEERTGGLPFEELDDSGASVHQLSPVQALALLRSTTPDLRQVRVTLLGVTIADVALSDRLTPSLEARVPALVERVLDRL